MRLDETCQCPHNFPLILLLAQLIALASWSMSVELCGGPSLCVWGASPVVELRLILGDGQEPTQQKCG